jgi:diaminohydroxyphosphoribosylaminopyrimidine deaminase/5-amino-6-(5-phosphoribosylamino)uracil reductase
MPPAAADAGFMAEAIALGRRHLGLTRPNPSVGAVVVRDGVVIGRGVTAPGGRPHAEPQALAEAGAAARGATLYVTLEPCSHHGRTPPCAEAVIAAGIARVVVALDDPDPRVAGRGYAMLRAAGVTVDTGILAEAAWPGLRAHLTRVRLGRPFVTLKLAISADGMIGRRDVGNVAITGAATRDFVHALRAEVDAIAVGAATARLDDPRLDVRLAERADRAPVRVVFDGRATLPPTARMLQGGAPVVVITADTAPAERRAALAAAGARLVAVPAGADGRLDLAAALAALAADGFGSLLVEGGAALADALIAADLVDETVTARSVVVVGPDGVAAPGLFNGPMPETAWWRTGFCEMGGDTIVTHLRQREDFPCSQASSPTSVR